jgi:hypothetical protein
MLTVQIEVSYHHDSDKPNYKALLDVPEGSDPDVHAMLLAINNEFGIDANRDADKIAAALDVAKRTGGDVKFKVGDDIEPNEYTLWYKAPERGETNPNFGFGEGDGRDRYVNVWLSVKPYEPDPAMRERLEKLDKKQLLAILLRTHAASYLSFPPE